MHLEFLVEEPSCEAALQNLVPKILGHDASFAIHVHQGKADLVKRLPGRLKGYKEWLPDYCGIVVLIDADDEDCHGLKAILEKAASDAGLISKSTAAVGSRFQVLNRLAIEELEAWFFGDSNALNAAYPHIASNLGNKGKYRNPDAVAGGTWEALERELQSAGYHLGGLPKIAAARDISAQMKPEDNKSKSFEVFREGLLDMVKMLSVN